MAITPESNKALKRRIYTITNDIAMLENRLYKVQRRVNKEQKRIDDVNVEIARLEAIKTKIQKDVK